MEFEHGVWGADLHLLPADYAAAEGLYHDFCHDTVTHSVTMLSIMDVCVGVRVYVVGQLLSLYGTTFSL